KRSADTCKAPDGGTACVGTEPSCCDACSSGNCAPSGSTTTTAPRATTTTAAPPTTTTARPTTTTAAPPTTTTAAPTTTTAAPTTTTTLGPQSLRFTSKGGTPSCGSAGFNPSPASSPFSGEIDSDTAGTTKINDLGLGCLYVGGGKA